MKKLTKYWKRMRLSFQLCIIACGFFLFLILPAAARGGRLSEGYYAVEINGAQVGKVRDTAEVEQMINHARRRLAKESDKLVMVDMNVEFKGCSVIFGRVDTREQIEENIYQVMSKSVIKQRARAYTVKINQFTVNLRSSDEVLALLKAAKDKYDEKDRFAVELVLDPTRELNVLTARIKDGGDAQEDAAVMLTAGVDAAFGMEEEVKVAVRPEDFDLGIESLDFGDTVEVVEAYVEPDEVASLEDAVELVTKDQEKNKIYEVAAGDTLSQIAEKNDTTVERIIAMNENIANEDSVIRAGDEITVTIPEPELAVTRDELVYYEEDYNAPVEYIDNDAWFVSETAVRQEPVAGHRKVVAKVSYRNEEENSREIVYENVAAKAVPKIVERGTKVPPTYIKPLSGGRLSSGFKARWGRMHKGIDWACPIGTAIKASSAGTVARAGWGSGYGYVVYINHADGRQTRYGHLSKILVKAGQKVSQGDKIALSGNTGRSTGPHVHFEILINGSAVNPLNYLN